MKIAEVFFSIQGEGVLAGVPSVFLRTSGCNLRCVWCDTPYTSWRPEGQEWTIEALTDYVQRHSKGYVVITGGEPMIQPSLAELTMALRRLGQHITIETAGTVFAPVACDLMSLSPKLAHSTPRLDQEPRWAELHELRRYQPDVLTRLMALCDYQMKFVVQAPQDLDEIQEIVRETGAAPAKVLLMPEGTTAEALRTRAPWVIEACKAHGFRYSPRLQIELWGARRGV